MSHVMAVLFIYHISQTVIFFFFYPLTCLFFYQLSVYFTFHTSYKLQLLQKERIPKIVTFLPHDLLFRPDGVSSYFKLTLHVNVTFIFSFQIKLTLKLNFRLKGYFVRTNRCLACVVLLF